MESEKRITARVGAFVITGILILGAVIFLLGSEKGIFTTYNTYTASFDSIEGLVPGSPVRLAGVEVGQVKSVRFYDDPNDKRVQATFDLQSKYADRIRADSKASVGSRGLLGDKALDLSLGSAEQAVIPVGGELLSASSADPSALIQRGAVVMDNAVSITGDLREMIAAYNSPTFKEDVAGLVASTRSIVDEVKGGKGALHQLIYDAETGRQVRTLVAEAAGAAASAEAAVGRVDKILAQVQSGNGLVGAMLYDPAGKIAIADLGKAADRIGALADAVRTEEDGLIHQLVYGAGAGQPNLGEELAAAARDMRLVVSRIEKGEGSLGALINDPTVYEDLKGILGNVKRNRILRELVRYSISQSDEVERYGKKE